MLRRLVKARMTRGLRRALRALQEEWRLSRLHYRHVKRARRLATGQALKLNLGSGENLKPGWINVDLEEGADLHLDLREPLPFRDGSVVMIYSEHFFEHLEYPDEARTLLRESFRVLAPGGIFSVGVPDTEWPLAAYARGEDDYFHMARDLHPKWCDTRMHNINYHFRQGREHKYAWDEETLGRVLEQAGFVSIARRPFDAALDTERRRPGTLYMQAFKPGRP